MRPRENKLTSFLEMCNSARRKGADRVVVASPGVLGDNCDEIKDSLNHLANFGLALVVISPEQPSQPPTTSA